MEELKGILEKKLEKEFENFLTETEKKSAKEIIQSSYEMVFKEDLKDIILSLELDSQEVKALLKLDNILQVAYEGWKENGASYTDILEDSFRDTLNPIVEEFIENKQRNNRIYRG